MVGAVELGVIYGVMALGVYLTFRVLNFADLTVDGSFTTGAGVGASMVLAGQDPALATLAGAGAGMLAGVITGLLHTKGGIDGLLSGILTMIALWSVNLRIMGKANLPLLRQDTLFTPLREAGILGTWTSVAVLAACVLLLGAAVVWFLSTDLGLSVQATGDNGPMVRSLGVSTDFTTILTLALSNGFVAACGALVAQYQGFADISMGIGLILVGLASVILGQALLGRRRVWQAVLAAVVGAVVYRLIIAAALAAGLDSTDVRAMTAILVVLALLLPRWGLLRRLPRLGRGGRVVQPPAVAPSAASPAGAAAAASAAPASDAKGA
ncbi:ABC transporter permease [Brevibacterium album]|uniref:ABC transporter permease n=1 Tax=Brevibacterium album TaxID=417948 RepID=UPI0004020D02|nr:ABC transporter permease [Brevibacterium album]